MERKRTVWTALALLGLLVVAVIGVSLLISLTLESGWLGGEKVGVIRIEGVITDSRETIEELRRFRDNPSIKAVVLRIDSPGGGGVHSQEIHTEVLKARKSGRLNMVASMGKLGAYRAYYIATARQKCSTK